MLFVAGANGIDWDLWMVPEDIGVLRFRKPAPVRLTAGPLSAGHAEFSPDSRRIFYVGDSDQAQLVRYDSRSRDWVPYLDGISAFQLDFSRNGEWITYVAHPGHSVWRSRIDGSQAMQVTSPPLDAVNPRFSPDRAQIVFFGYEPGHRTGMFLVSANGGSVIPLVPKGKAVEAEEPSWSPDGRKVLYGAGRSSFWVIDLATRDAKELPGSEGLRFPRWSPDGKYAVAADAQSHLWLYAMADHSRVLLTIAGAEYPTWSRDSRYVYFANTACTGWYRAGIEDHTVEQIASLAGLHMPVAAMGWAGMAPDGSIISARDVSTRNIYAIDWVMR